MMVFDTNVTPVRLPKLVENAQSTLRSFRTQEMSRLKMANGIPMCASGVC